MNGYLLDTNIVIDYLKGEERLVSFVEKLVRDQQAHLSVITVAELCAGPRSDPSDKLYDDLAAAFAIEPILSPEAITAGQFRRRFMEKGRKLSLTDLLIAATAVRHDLCLVTRNVPDFPMSEVTLYQDLAALYP
jgi:predicted nucleic acid-binding protein